MKGETLKVFNKACKKNALTFDVTLLAAESAAETEDQVNRLLKKIPENGYLIFENSDRLLRSLRPDCLKDATAQVIVETLIKAKTTTRPDISIMMRGRNKELFYTRYFDARHTLNYIHDCPPYKAPALS